MKNGTGSGSAESTATNEAKGEQPGTQTPTAQGATGAVSSGTPAKKPEEKGIADELIDWLASPL